ncbi:MAG: hypothetical protein GY739_18820, partial [Mesoflavibacter sp.]|nr:hypothetical protein [Mesoflavibacter sp.]
MEKVCFMVHQRMHLSSSDNSSVSASDNDEDDGESVTRGADLSLYDDGRSSDSSASETPKVRFFKKDLVKYMHKVQNERDRLRLLIRLLLLVRDKYTKDGESPQWRLPYWMNVICDGKASFDQIVRWLQRFVECLFDKTKSVAWTEEQAAWLKIKDPQLVKLILMRTEYILRDQRTIIPPEEEQQSSDGEQVESFYPGDRETVAPQLLTARSLIDFAAHPSDSDIHEHREQNRLRQGRPTNSAPSGMNVQVPTVSDEQLQQVTQAADLATHGVAHRTNVIPPIPSRRHHVGQQPHQGSIPSGGAGDGLLEQVSEGHGQSHLEHLRPDDETFVRSAHTSSDSTSGTTRTRPKVVLAKGRRKKKTVVSRS